MNIRRGSQGADELESRKLHKKHGKGEFLWRTKRWRVKVSKRKIWLIN